MTRTAIALAFVLLTAGVVYAADGLFSEAQTRHGETVYKARCAACHGQTLDGGQEAPPLNGADFWAQWDRQTARALYSRILSSMPPDGPGTLSEREVIDIVAHIVHSNSAPYGSRTVETPAELNQIKLERPLAKGDFAP